MEALAVMRALAAPCVEERLTLLARSGAPLRRVVAMLAGRLVATSAWEPLGYVRPRDYAVERLGLSARQVQDLAHVDRVLRGLPRIEAAFVAGRITWTKARLLCRVAMPEDEGRWLEAALRLTARALAREVRAVDARSLERRGGVPESDEDGVEEIARETVWLRVTPRVRARWSRARLVARRVAGEALSQAAVAEAIAAEVISAIGLDVDPGLSPPFQFPRAANGCAQHEQPGARASASPDSSLRPDSGAHGCTAHGLPSLPAFLAPLIEDLESADARELDARLRRALRMEQRLMADMAPLLLEVARSRGYRSHGCSSLAAFAREKLGMSPRKAQALLRLERANEVCPALGEAFRAGRLSSVQAQTLIPILVLDHAMPWRSAWVAHAERVSVRRLEEDVERALVSGALNPGSLSEDVQTGAHPTDEKSDDDPRQDETIKLFFNAPVDVARLFKAVLASVQRRIERRNGRTVRSAGGSDDLANRTALCAAHHQRGVHGRIMRIRGPAPDELRFELPLVTYGPGEQVLVSS